MAIPTRPADGGYYDPNAPVVPAPDPGATPGGGGGRGGLWEYLRSILDPTQLAGLEPFFGGGRGGGGGFGDAAAQDAYLTRKRTERAAQLASRPAYMTAGTGRLPGGDEAARARGYDWGPLDAQLPYRVSGRAPAAAVPAAPAVPAVAPLPAGTGEVTAHGYPLLASMLSGGGLQSAFARRANQDAGGGMGGTAAAPAAAAAVAPAAPRVAPTSFGSYLARLGRR